MKASLRDAFKNFSVLLKASIHWIHFPYQKMINNRRFKTPEGKFVGINKIPTFLVSFYQAIIRKFTGQIPRLPWIPFSAINKLQTILTQEFVVWEVGAGFSTIWLSYRVKKVVSIEASEEWFENLNLIIKNEGHTNVDLRLEWQGEKMSDFSELPDESLDLLFIDGGPRGSCLRNGFSKVKHGGYIYLDNWDSKIFWGEEADFPSKNASLISESYSFIDYVPAQVGVYEGLLLRKA